MRRVSPSVDLAAVIWDEVEQQTCFGQIEKSELYDYARMSYLGGLDHPDSRVIAAILEELTRYSGSWGAYGVLADLPEGSPLFEGFRIAGFNIWAGQDVYEMKQTPAGSAGSWRAVRSQDLPAIAKLHKKLLPAFTQPIAPISHRVEMGLIVPGSQGQCLAFAENYQGPKGICVTPLIDPEADQDHLLVELADAISNPTHKPIYLCARSYLPLISLAADQLGYPKVSSQALMVKHLVLRDKVEQGTLQKIFEAGSIEGSLPISQIENKSN